MEDGVLGDISGLIEVASSPSSLHSLPGIPGRYMRELGQKAIAPCVRAAQRCGGHIAHACHAAAVIYWEFRPVFPFLFYPSRIPFLFVLVVMALLCKYQ